MSRVVGWWEARRWDSSSLVPALEKRTRMHIGRDGLFGNLREQLGVKDTHVGIPAFDVRYTVRGSHEGRPG